MAERDQARHRPQGVAGTWPPRGAAQAGSLAPSGAPAWTSLLEQLRALVRAEAGAGRLLPWVPVAFGSGIALYFFADHEPVLWVAAAAAIALVLGAVSLRRTRLFAEASAFHSMVSSAIFCASMMSPTASSPCGAKHH